MSFSEIFSDSIKYPFSDIVKFLIVGVISLIAGLSKIITSFGIDNSLITFIVLLIGLIFSIILSGYGVDVIRKGLERSDEIPDIDLMTNLVNGIKSLIISIVYFLIPIIIIFILAMFTGILGAGLNHIDAAIIVTIIISIILFIIFSLLDVVAIARFADTNDMGAALDIGSVFEDIKKIGVLKLIGFVVIAAVTILVAYAILSLISVIPYAGPIITTILAGGFTVLFYNKAIGLLYSEI